MTENRRHKIGLLDYETGEIVGELQQGDRIIRKSTIEQLSKYIMNWKSNKNIQFIKIYRKEKMRHMKNTELTAHAKAFLFDMEMYIEYKTNILINEQGDPVSNADLEKITNMNRKTINKVLKELQEELYIKIEGKTNKRKIYVNPYLYCAGNMIETEIVMYFEDYRSRYNIDISQYLK